MGYLTEKSDIDVQRYVNFLARFEKDYQTVIANAVNYCAGIQEDIRQNAKNLTLECNCAYRQMGFISENNEVNVQQYVNFLVGYDQEYTMVTANAIANCADIQADLRRDVSNIMARCSAFAMLFHCAFDCSYREMGFLQGEDEINVENINSYQAAYDAAYQETIANAVNHCMTTKDSIRQEAELVKTTCSAFAVKFHACIVLEVVVNCPAERWTESPICEKPSSNCITKRQLVRLFCQCVLKCIYEKLGAIDGMEVHLEKLYPLAETFPIDYRNTVHMAIDECSKVTSDCISKSQQKELQYCCEMEELIPRDVRTKCQERAAVHHNPGFPMYDMCQKQCIFEELGTINGNELQLEALYPLAERFPVDYREA
uniref:Uncharacterized protein n=1 Tax=Anopheles culicifacies TaxID=139723 RepID=A0A182MQG4_9DIPT